MKLYDLFKKLEENGTLTIVDEREDSSYIYLHLCDAEEYEGECEVALFKGDDVFFDIVRINNRRW